ncbi:MAG: alpha-mannosidase, partial [Thermoanaerobaculia bacterium]|nr:alpha-mannosidase [Thermoanaerobaculia bacterium]
MSDSDLTDRPPRRDPPRRTDASAEPERADARPLLIVAPTVHLDTQWRWTVQETIGEFLPRTLSENFALFRRHPDYVLGFEGAFRYMLTEEYYPQAFEELVEWCRRRRWRPAGGMLDAPDVNVVAPESLIRHILYGNGYFAERLGERCRDLFLPDCFGFGWALPSVAAHCGLESISTSKLIKWKSPDEIPLDVGRWRGPDGAEIVAVLQPGGYGEGLDENLARSDDWRRRLEATGSQCGVAVGVRYMGVGDRGGAPDAESIARLEESLETEGAIDVRCAPAAEILDHLTPQARRRLPLHDDEILLPTHGTGCWTSQAALKRWNRRNELLAGAAERAAVIADWLGGMPYPDRRLELGWRQFLWHQMHDDLTGTSIPAAYRFTWNDEAVAANLFAGVLTDAVGVVADALDTRTKGLPLVVYNPLGCRRRDIVEIALPASMLPAEHLAVLDPDDARLPLQIEPLGRTDERAAAHPSGGRGRRVRLLFPAAVGALSFSVFRLVDEREAGESRWEPEPLSVGARALENHRFRVGIDDTGELTSIVDRR